MNESLLNQIKMIRNPNCQKSCAKNRKVKIGRIWLFKQGSFNKHNKYHYSNNFICNPMTKVVAKCATGVKNCTFFVFK